MEVYCSQTSVIYFANYRGVHYSEVSARRELTIHTGNSSYQNLMKDFSVLKKYEIKTHHSSVRYISASEQYAVEISLGEAQGPLLAAALEKQDIFNNIIVHSLYYR